MGYTTIWLTVGFRQYKCITNKPFGFESSELQGEELTEDSWNVQQGERQSRLFPPTGAQTSGPDPLKKKLGLKDFGFLKKKTVFFYSKGILHHTGHVLNVQQNENSYLWTNVAANWLNHFKWSVDRCPAFMAQGKRYREFNASGKRFVWIVEWYLEPNMIQYPPNQFWHL